MTSSRLIPLIIASALFMENMDGTIIATSLPAIARDLGTDAIVLKLAFTTYLHPGQRLAGGSLRGAPRVPGGGRHLHPRLHCLRPVGEPW
jgi:MFS family permease